MIDLGGTQFYTMKINLKQYRYYYNTLYTSRSSRPTDVLCHALLGSPACLIKYLAVLKLLTKYVFADPYANNTTLLYKI